jgi:hypothetical protein
MHDNRAPSAQPPAEVVRAVSAGRAKARALAPHKIMKNIVLLCAAALLMSGCGWFDRKVAAAFGGAAKSCVDGVLYLQFTSGASVAYNRDGSVRSCEK